MCHTRLPELCKLYFNQMKTCKLIWDGSTTAETYHECIHELSLVSPRSKDSLLQVHALWLEVLRFNGPAPFEITDRTVEICSQGRSI